jgi:hypothetical protein
MEFPVRYVPFITAPMLIPLIAVPHVIVAQFAVGAGILLADLVRRAHRDHRVELLDGDDKNDLRKLVPLYFLGAVIYGSAGAIYASSILQALPRFWFIVAGISMIAGVLLAAAYWKNPSRITGIGLILAQFAVLLSNAIARQWVQLSELIKWYDPYKAPIRGEWGSFALFMTALLAALVIISWIGLTALRRTRNNAV